MEVLHFGVDAVVKAGVEMNGILVEALTMEVVMEVTEVLSVGLGMAVAGSTAGSEDAEASDPG